MDKIQKTLIKSGRKDLAHKYFKRIIAASLKPHEQHVKESFFNMDWFKRKPYGIDNLKVAPFKEIKKYPDLVKNLKKLKILTPEKVWDDKFEGAITYDFDKKVPIIFILKVKNRYILINSEGYSYPRYAGELKNYKP